MTLWDQIKRSLEHRLEAHAYGNWVMRTTLASHSGDSLAIAVPDAATKMCMEQDYSETVMTAIRDLALPIRSVSYEVSAAALNAISPAASDASGFRSDMLFPAPGTQLNSRFTFDSFVVGPCNQFAHAASQAVSTMPGRSYNPLFIYGGVGMGKTHLMHAIGRALLTNFANQKIVYTTSERFMNLMINCIKGDRMVQFHQHFRSADMLLIDDIQFLNGKERTQEEFFYTFNELYDHQKQIVISSDAQPSHTPGLVERLRSRFEWGLMVDVQPPDLETKMAILDKKAEQEGAILPEDVRIFIATKTKSNVRELEGSLVKLIAYSSICKAPISLSMAQHILKNMVQSQEKKITIESIVRVVAERFSLQPGQLKLKTNARQISYPRQIATYLAKELTQASLVEIGRHLGGKHHTTVLHSIHKIAKARLIDPDLNRMLHSLTDSLN